MAFMRMVVGWIQVTVGLLGIAGGLASLNFSNKNAAIASMVTLVLCFLLLVGGLLLVKSIPAPRSVFEEPDAFKNACPNCGVPLRSLEERCPSCGKPITMAAKDSSIPG